ncbi:MAG: methyltransferase domain-containing protein [Aggregatilineales bacterium]
MSDLQTFFNTHKPKSTPGIFQLALAHTPPDTGLALDLCCGAGKLTALIAEQGYKAYGIDISSRFIGQNGSGANGFLIADVNRSLPLASGCATVVYCIDSFQYATDPDSLLSEVARVLKPGGMFIFSTQNNYNPAGVKRWLIEKIAKRPWSPWLVHPIENHVTYPWLRRALARHGFNIQYRRGLQFLTALVSLFPGFIRNTSPWKDKPWRAPSSVAQRVRFPQPIEESVLARFAMVVFVCARKQT